MVGPFAGRLSDRFGALDNSVSRIGNTGSCPVPVKRITTTTPLIQIGIIEAIYGVGGGLFWPAKRKCDYSRPRHLRVTGNSGMDDILSGILEWSE